MLYGPHHKLKLKPETIEAVCLAASREFYDNASSGNYTTGDMKLAYEWYVAVTPSSKRVLKYSQPECSTAFRKGHTRERIHRSNFANQFLQCFFRPRHHHSTY